MTSRRTEEEHQSECILHLFFALLILTVQKHKQKQKNSGTSEG
jgi:hypothetical protein